MTSRSINSVKRVCGSAPSRRARSTTARVLAVASTSFVSSTNDCSSSVCGLTTRRRSQESHPFAVARNFPAHCAEPRARSPKAPRAAGSSRAENLVRGEHRVIDGGRRGINVARILRFARTRGQGRRRRRAKRSLEAVTRSWHPPFPLAPTPNPEGPMFLNETGS
jgi:hypothetical protein